jgi:RHS repeat-associated protein
MQRYVHDGDRVSLDVDAAGNVTNEYFNDPISGQLLAIRNTAWLNTWYQAVALTDPDLGTIRGLATFSGGKLIKQYAEAPWGNAVADTGVAVRFRMAGQEFDAETGLYYMRSRYYDPALGRFISEDPAGLAGGLNPYEYANNDPVNWRDPSGMAPGKKDADSTGFVLPEVTFTFPQIGGIAPPPFLPAPGTCTTLPAIGPGRGIGGRGSSPTPDIGARRGQQVRQQPG